MTWNTQSFLLDGCGYLLALHKPEILHSLEHKYEFKGDPIFIIIVKSPLSINSKSRLLSCRLNADDRNCGFTFKLQNEINQQSLGIDIYDNRFVSWLIFI